MEHTMAISIIKPLAFAVSALSLAACAGTATTTQQTATMTQATSKTMPKGTYFNRVASFGICEQISANCDTNTETVAEIASVSEDGMTLVYTDGEQEKIGFVDITNPAKPMPKGVVDVGGEPTSVYVKGNYALVGVNTSESYIKPSGVLKVVDMTSKKTVASIDMGGQPDSVAVSKDGKYAAIAIENERDEDAKVNGEEGALPQLPAGKLVIVNLMDKNPTKWQAKTVELTGLKGMLANSDPEPEYVDFNGKNEILVTMQENNHIAIVDAATGKVTSHFSAGSVNLTNVDIDEEKPRLITLDKKLSNVAREPDGASWINDTYFATANEGDWKGGSRGFSIFNKNGNVVFDSGNFLEHLAVSLGQYPEKRSANKGNEPENAEFGKYGSDNLLFIASERANMVTVYDVSNPAKPKFRQALPAGVGPEGILAIPNRNLLIAASEVDNRGDKMRSVLNIYQYQNVAKPTYPSLRSATANGVPIAWNAMSGLAVNGTTLYAVNDSFNGKNSIFSINTNGYPALINKEMKIKDSNGVLAALPVKQVAKAGAKSAERNMVFDNQDLAKLINTDKTVNIDPEGIAVASDGGFWIASEGSGTLTEAKKRPLNSVNMVLKTDKMGNITQVFTLPEAVNAKQIRFGFEGVAEQDGKVYVAFQRAWAGEKHPRIGILDPKNGEWMFVHYPLDTAESQRGGWVGLSDIAPLGNGKFAVLERDNQGNYDAAVKRIYQIDLSNVQKESLVKKTLVRDLIKRGDLTTGGNLAFEKVEGLAVDSAGNAWIINDNDGVDDNSGETMLKNLGQLF